MNEESGNEQEPTMQKPQEEEQKASFSLKEIQDLQETARDFKDKYLRVLAESENARKRLQKEKQEMTKYAVENVIAEFLHPLDSFEKALHFASGMSDEVRNWAIGFEMILTQFKQVLTNHGVNEYESNGKPFNPHLHEAVETIETDSYPSGTVIQEFVKGYKMGDKVIRVARVKVAKSPEKNNLEATSKD